MPAQESTRGSLLDRTAAVCRAHGRDDLLTRVGSARRRLEDPTVRVLVVGEFKQGKSQLINALVNAPVCPVDDDVATAVPTEVSYGATPRAFVLLAPDELSEVTPVPHAREVPVETLPSYVLERRSRVDGQRVVGARAELPRDLLHRGLVFVDTPGVGGQASAHSAATLAALTTADAVLLVTDASSEFTAPELAFLQEALAACPTVACVLSKTDLFPAWRRVRDLDEGHLRRFGLSVPILPVSSTMRLAAAQSKDAAVNAESGFPALLTHLRSNVLGHRDDLLSASTAHDVAAIVDGIRTPLTAERRALEDPDSVPGMVSELTAARGRVAELKRRSSRWQVTPPGPDARPLSFPPRPRRCRRRATAGQPSPRRCRPVCWGSPGAAPTAPRPRPHSRPPAPRCASLGWMPGARRSRWPRPRVAWRRQDGPLPPPPCAAALRGSRPGAGARRRAGAAVGPGPHRR